MHVVVLLQQFSREPPPTYAALHNCRPYANTPTPQGPSCPAPRRSARMRGPARHPCRRARARPSAPRSRCWRRRRVCSGWCTSRGSSGTAAGAAASRGGRPAIAGRTEGGKLSKRAIKKAASAGWAREVATFARECELRDYHYFSAACQRHQCCCCGRAHLEAGQRGHHEPAQPAANSPQHADHRAKRRVEPGVRTPQPQALSLVSPLLATGWQEHNHGLVLGPSLLATSRQQRSHRVGPARCRPPPWAHHAIVQPHRTSPTATSRFTSMLGCDTRAPRAVSACIT